MPPAAKPVTMRTGLFGQSWADAAPGRSSAGPNRASAARIEITTRTVTRRRPPGTAIAVGLRRASLFPTGFLVAGFTLLDVGLLPHGDGLRLVVVHLLVHANAVLADDGGF